MSKSSRNSTSTTMDLEVSEKILTKLAKAKNPNFRTTAATWETRTRWCSSKWPRGIRRTMWTLYAPNRENGKKKLGIFHQALQGPSPIERNLSATRASSLCRRPLSCTAIRRRMWIVIERPLKRGRMIASVILGARLYPKLISAPPLRVR